MVIEGSVIIEIQRGPYLSLDEKLTFSIEHIKQETKCVDRQRRKLQ